MQRTPIALLLAAAACSAQTPAPSEGSPDGASPSPTSTSTTSPDAGPPPDGSQPTTNATPVPSGWLYTQGARIYLSDGAQGTPWVGRGVNADDVFFCGYNSSLWMTKPESTLTTLGSHIVSDWKAKFVRVSLGMNSFSKVSWTSGDPAAYKTPMTSVIEGLGATPGVYVLVTLRSDATMSNAASGDATFLPTAATDATYQALVDTFAHSNYVLFGVSNEPGGNALSNDTIRAAMDHAVATIRAEEDKLGVPHHIVSVQGNDWTSDIGFYADKPLAYDNVVYEVHGYPPPASSYTYSNIPVIIGEYGSLANASAFFADIESKGIPSLAWDFDSYSDCAPDLLAINQSASNLVPTAWGSTVKTYLTSH